MMFINDVLTAYNYWTKTPNVLSNASDSIGFAIKNPSTLIPYTPLAYVSPTVKEQEKIFRANTAPAVAKLPETIGAGLVNGGQLAGKVIKAGGGVVGDILETAGDFIDPEKSVLSSALIKYALIAGGVFALYKFGGEFIATKGAKFARR